MLFSCGARNGHEILTLASTNPAYPSLHRHRFPLAVGSQPVTIGPTAVDKTGNVQPTAPNSLTPGPDCQ